MDVHVDPASGEKRKKLNVLAERMVDWAMEGQSWAAIEVGNRLDGRPASNDTLTLEPGLSLIELLTRVRNGQTLDLKPDSVRDGDDGGEPRSLADFSSGEPSEE